MMVLRRYWGVRRNCMKFNKKIICSLFSILILVAVLVPFTLYAQTVDGQTTSSTFTLKNPLKVDSVGGLISNFVEIFSYVVILFAVLALIWVGLQFILVRGDVTKMKELKEWLLYIVVGVAVIIGASIIIRVVISTLSATGIVDQGVINSTNNALGGH